MKKGDIILINVHHERPMNINLEDYRDKSRTILSRLYGDKWVYPQILVADPADKKLALVLNILSSNGIGVAPSYDRGMEDTKFQKINEFFHNLKYLSKKDGTVIALSNYPVDDWFVLADRSGMSSDQKNFFLEKDKSPTNFYVFAVNEYNDLTVTES